MLIFFGCVSSEVVQSKEFPDIGATELILSNGMRVCYKRTEFLEDQVNGHFHMLFISI